ncbi:hypothetical protein TNCV_3201011 [Trichonephila clavipes]|nr:hypothetical protein TNCV_3201011 [Trichonephila clavipes]
MVCPPPLYPKHYIQTNTGGKGTPSETFSSYFSKRVPTTSEQKTDSGKSVIQSRHSQSATMSERQRLVNTSTNFETLSDHVH